MSLRSRVLNGPQPRKCQLGQSRVITSLREGDQAILSQSSICESLSCTEIHCLVYIASEIHMKITMSSESSDLEMRFEADDMEMNFINGYELEDEGHSSPVSPPSPQTLCDSNDDGVAYIDEPLADAE